MQRAQIVNDVVANSSVLNARKNGSVCFGLEALRCTDDRCKICSGGGAHEATWIVYWFDPGVKLRSVYLGDCSTSE